MSPFPPLLDPRQQITLLVVAVLALALILYDVAVAICWGSSATVSWTLAVVARRWPIVAFGLSMVIGHIFLVRWVPNLWHPKNIIGVVVLMAGLAAGATMAAQQPDPEPDPPKDD